MSDNRICDDMQVAASFAQADIQMVSKQEPKSNLDLVIQTDRDEESSDSESEDEEDEKKIMKNTMDVVKKVESMLDEPLDAMDTGEKSRPIVKPSCELTDESPVRDIGTILHVNRVANTITIQSDVNKPVLDEEGVLCLKDKRILGCIDETFGPVTSPLYLIRFETSQDIPIDIQPCERVYVATQHASIVNPDNLRDKGTDRGEDDDDSSDDEVEKKKKAAHQTKRKRNQNNTRPPPARHPVQHPPPPYYPPYGRQQPGHYPPPPPQQHYSHRESPYQYNNGGYGQHQHPYAQQQPYGTYQQQQGYGYMQQPHGYGHPPPRGYNNNGYGASHPPPHDGYYYNNPQPYFSRPPENNHP